jgi:hypothetical protein
LPTLDEQKALVEELFNEQRDSENLRGEAASICAQAWSDFEAAVGMSEDAS